MESEYLEKIGLTKNQSSVYLAVLRLGSCTAQSIIKDSGMHRAIIYDSLEQLREIGLISFVIKDYKKYFQAASPKRLLDFLEEKKEIIRQALPKLEAIENANKEDISAFVYKGREGLKTIHSEMLKEGKDIWMIGAKGVIFDELPYFMPNFERERLKKKLKFIGLWDKKEVKERLLKQPLFEGKSLPEGFDSDAVANIFGNKVAIVLWKDKFPTAFVIDNKSVAEAFRKWFQLISRVSD